ncbi:MAG: hypothetical protein ORN98_07990, partial [Alphaproteobacteria bacterium]|nr:hypothetical protein [Alphaproteobacteria bacterium]
MTHALRSWLSQITRRILPKNLGFAVRAAVPKNHEKPAQALHDSKNPSNELDPRRLEQLSHFVWNAIFLLLVLMWAAVAYLIDTDFKRDAHEARHTVNHLNRAFGEYVNRNLMAAADIVMASPSRQADFIIRDKVSPRLTLPTNPTHDVADQASLDDLVSLDEMDEMPPEEHQREPRNTTNIPARFTLSPPEQDSEGQWVIWLRSVNPSIQKTTPLNPDHFVRVFHDMDQDEASVMSLISQDGRILVRTRDAEKSYQLSIAQTVLFQRMVTEGEGAWFGTSPEDGIRRLCIFKKLPDFGVFILTGIEAKRLFSTYYSARASYIGFALGMSALMLLMAALSSHSLRREARFARLLIQANQVKTQFLSNMSHEIRTPLNG